MQVWSRSSWMRGIAACAILASYALHAPAEETQHSSESEKKPSSIERWMELRKNLSSDPEAALRQLREFAKRDGIGIELWVNSGVSEERLRALGWYPWHEACGLTVTAFVERIPLEHPLVSADSVMELSPDGRVLRSWPIPANAVGIGLDGDRAVVPIFGGHFSWGISPHLAISTNGRFELALADASRRGSVQKCPANLDSELGPSDYRRCEWIKVRSNASPRWIAYEGPCT